MADEGIELRSPFPVVPPVKDTKWNDLPSSADGESRPVEPPKLLPDIGEPHPCPYFVGRELNFIKPREEREKKKKEVRQLLSELHSRVNLILLVLKFITVAFMTFGPRCVICNHVPLRSLGISRLRISSTGTPTFNLGLSEGAPDNSKMLKSSTEYDVPC
ncbi:hypothetical protein AVEN_203904-1 [Araneus ventricosus]|uniref:Uncharacterized protein n=1 Tax=Araneus ventricosus TaxID=182803 RepID=A0A4Y2VX10_ARAVE|nr:hypothetical protein AVEN_203904-1 [Araneus ventricosus]